MAMEEYVSSGGAGGKATAMALVFPLPTILSYGLLTGACSVLLVFVMPLCLLCPMLFISLFSNKTCIHIYVDMYTSYPFTSQKHLGKIFWGFLQH